MRFWRILREFAAKDGGERVGAGGGETWRPPEAFWAGGRAEKTGNAGERPILRGILRTGGRKKNGFFFVFLLTTADFSGKMEKLFIREENIMLMQFIKNFQRAAVCAAVFAAAPPVAAEPVSPPPFLFW